MKNILFIGPYKDSNGLGYASRRYINCLAAKSDINLSIKPIFFTNSHIQNPLDLNTLESYENTYYHYYDIVIQYGYPEYYVYDERFGKNVGIVEIETRSRHSREAMPQVGLNSPGDGGESSGSSTNGDR